MAKRTRDLVKLSPKQLACCFILAGVVGGGCGVEEHLHEQLTQTPQGGNRAKPPPLAGTTQTGSGGAAVPTSGGAPASGAAGTSTASGGVGMPGSGGQGPGAGSGPIGGQPPVGGQGTTGGSAPIGGQGALGGSATSGGASGGSVAQSTGGVSGITIDINGTVLPKENVVAFIHFGHSNMAGRASGPSASRPYHFTEENLYAWVYRNNVWEPALEPKTAGDADSQQFGQALGGPGTTLLKQAAEMSPNHYFVSLGFGKGSAYCSQFMPGALYYDQVMAAPKQLKGKVTFAAIVVMLGITERHGSASDINGYPNCLNTIVTQIRNDLNEPDLPLIFQDYEMGATGDELKPTGTFAQQIIPQIHNVVNVVKNSAMVATDNIPMQDDHHFNLDGHKEYAKRVLAVMKDKGWFRW